jgi:hypothetical protein
MRVYWEWVLRCSQSHSWFHPGAHWIGGWTSPRTSLDIVTRKILASAGNGTPVAQPIASHFTDSYFSSILLVRTAKFNYCIVIQWTKCSIKHQSLSSDSLIVAQKLFRAAAQWPELQESTLIFTVKKNCNFSTYQNLGLHKACFTLNTCNNIT